jgi:hypothetical protein
VIRTPEDAERIKQVEAARMSWCAAEVHKTHGDIGVCSNPDCPVCAADAAVIYPDLTPRGIVPGEVILPAAPVDTIPLDGPAPALEPTQAVPALPSFPPPAEVPPPSARRTSPPQPIAVQATAAPKRRSFWPFSKKANQAASTGSAVQPTSFNAPAGAVANPTGSAGPLQEALDDRLTTSVTVGHRPAPAIVQVPVGPHTGKPITTAASLGAPSPANVSR